MNKVHALSILLLIFSSVACKHPYFEVVSIASNHAEHAVDTAQFVVDVDTVNWEYVGSFNTNRKSTFEVQGDTIRNHAIELGANLIRITSTKYDNRGGLSVNGDLYYSSNPKVNPTLAAGNTLVFYCMDAGEEAYVNFYGDSIGVRIPAGYRYSVWLDETVKRVSFSVNGQQQVLELNNNPVVIKLPGYGVGRSGNLLLTPTFSGGGIGVGVFVPISSTGVEFALQPRRDYWSVLEVLSVCEELKVTN